MRHLQWIQRSGERDVLVTQSNSYWDLPEIASPHSEQLLMDPIFTMETFSPGERWCRTAVHPGSISAQSKDQQNTWVAVNELRARFERGQQLISPVLARVCGLGRGHPREWQLAAGISLLALRTPTLPPATQTNTYLVGTHDFIIVDPATPFADEQAILDALLHKRCASGRRVRQIWLTHHHDDHVGDALRLAKRHGVDIAAHPETASRLAGRVPINRLLADGDVEELAGRVPRRLRAVFTPGHAPGHHCFVEEFTQMCIAGDMVAGLGTILIDPSEGDMSQYIASLERLAGLGLRRLLPAHGPILVDPDAVLSSYIAHRRWREDQVMLALIQGGSIEQLVETVYQDVSPSLHLLASRSLLAHLEKLAMEGKALCDGDRWQRGHS